MSAAYVGYSGCPSWSPSPIIISSGYASVLDDSHPSHVYQCSCLNGYPEVSDNLGTALLYNGAVSTVSASRVSWYSPEAWNTGKRYICDNASIGYYYCKDLAASNKEASKALFDVKSDMGTNSNEMWTDGSSWMNLFDFNLYGDPSTSIIIKGSTTCPDCPADGVIANANYPAGITCSCENDTCITLGDNITFGSGAILNLSAPTVTTSGSNIMVPSGVTVTIKGTTITLGPGFHAESGSTVSLGQQ